MTLRRLYVLVTCLPAEAPLWAVLREAEEKKPGVGKPSVERLRQRAAELAEQRAATIEEG